MKKLILLFFLFSSLFPALLFAQQGNVKLGSEMGQYRQYNGGFYDYSDPEAVNIKVSVWGFVRFPGYYLIPSYTTPKELMSLAGGPTDAALLEDLRIYRVREDSTQTLIKFSYNDLLWEKQLSSKKDNSPSLLVGDVLVVPGEPRFYFRDTVSLVVQITTALISVLAFFITISK